MERTFPIRLLVRRVLAGLLLSTIGCGLAAQPAGVASAGILRVTATVLPFTRVELQAPPGALAITAADIERGFVDVDAPLGLTITTNSAQGATLLFATFSPHVEQALVTGLAEPIHVGRGVRAHHVPIAGRGLSRLALSLRFRFYLAASTPPGMHPWPLRMSTEFL